MSRALVLMSGGIDSAASLAWAGRNHEIVALSFLYHLRPFRERLSVHRLLQSYPGRLIEVPMPFVRESGDLPVPITGVPEGYISNRNLMFYSVAGYMAETHGCDLIVGGHNRGDREDFPDAASEFFAQLESLMNRALLTRKIRIELPLAAWDKREVLQHAVEWDVPLQHTWSCYWDADAPCGACASCRERQEAFDALGIPDPLLRS